jgi:hypothetical protein
MRLRFWNICSIKKKHCVPGKYLIALGGHAFHCALEALIYAYRDIETL